MENISQQDNFNSIIQSLSKLDLIEMDQVMSSLLGLRRQKLPSVLSELESSLLKKINTPIPSVIQRRYTSLLDKRDKQTLKEDEYNELIEELELNPVINVVG